MNADAHVLPSVEEFRAEVRRFLATAAIPGWVADDAARFESLRAWQRELFDAGLLGVAWPAKFGGRGLSVLHKVAVNQELLLRRAPSPIGEIGLEVVGPTILAFGSDEQRHTLLPRILSGEDIWCQGFSEPGAGSDLGSLGTAAVQTDGVFLVNGQKTWSSYAKYANRCALLVRTDREATPKHKGISYLLVDLALDGIEVRPITQITGGEEFAEIFLTDVNVPVSALLGERNAGWAYTMHTLAHERGPYMLRRNTELSAMFGRAIAALSDTGFVEAGEVGRVRVLLDMLDAQGARTAARLATGDGPAAEDSLDKQALTMVDQSVTGALSGLTEGFRTVHGAHPGGLDVDELTEAYFFGRAASIYGGTGQIQRNIIAERLLGLPRG